MDVRVGSWLVCLVQFLGGRPGDEVLWDASAVDLPTEFDGEPVEVFSSLPA